MYMHFFVCACTCTCTGNITGCWQDCWPWLLLKAKGTLWERTRFGIHVHLEPFSTIIYSTCTCTYIGCHHTCNYMYMYVLWRLCLYMYFLWLCVWSFCAHVHVAADTASTAAAGQPAAGGGGRSEVSWGDQAGPAQERGADHWARQAFSGQWVPLHPSPMYMYIVLLGLHFPVGHGD